MNARSWFRRLRRPAPGNQPRTLPISVRITLVFTALMLGCLAIVGTFAYVELGRDMRKSLDSAILAATDEIRDRLPQASTADERTAAGVATTEIQSQVLDGQGRVVSGSTAELAGQPLLTPAQFRQVRDGAPLFADSTGATEPMRVHAFAVDGVAGVSAVVLAADLGPVSEARQAYLSSVFPIALVAAGLAAVSGLLAARRALHPVARLTREAAELGSGDLSRRLAVSATQDELSRLGRTLNQMLQRLEDSVQRERDFTADASHELRTPLAIMRAELELTLQRADDGEARASVVSALEECDRLQGLAEDLLLIARAESIELDSRTPLDLGDVTDTVLHRLGGLAEREHIVLSRSGEAVVHGDPRALERALSNLVENALRHVGPGGRVDVTIESDVDSRTVARSASGHAVHGTERAALGAVRWKVTDNGPGIPPEDRDRLIQRFTRADRSHAPAGAGLGLAIVDTVARGHGGTMSLDTSPGGGLQVTLTLPPRGSGTDTGARFPLA
jgi:signal transduction histidine kinase